MSFTLDRDPPSVTVLAVTLTSEMWEMRVRSTDSLSGVAEVRLFAGANDLGSFTPQGNGEYVFNLSLSNLPAGVVNLRVVARDRAGNEANLVLTVDRMAPNVVWKAPADGSQVFGSVPLEVEASDNVGVAKVEFFGGSTKLGEATTAPYTFTWNTAPYPDGPVTLKARAVDNAGNVAEATLTVTVANGLTVDRFVITTPAHGDTVGPGARREIVAVTVGVNGTLPPGVEVTKVDVYINGQFAGTATQQTSSDGFQVYVYGWDTSQAVPGHDPTKSGDRVITARVYYTGGDTFTNGVLVRFSP